MAVAVSESSTVRMFDDGMLISEITPELYLLDRYTSQLRGRAVQTEDQVTIVARAE